MINFTIGMAVDFMNKKQAKKQKEKRGVRAIDIGERSKGMTLIELLIGMGIFILVVGTGSGVLAYTIRTQRSLLTYQSITSELNFNLEYMSRALRMVVPDEDGSCTEAVGRTYKVDGSSLTFINHLQEGACQKFFLEGGTLKYDPDTTTSGDILDMSSPDTEIESLRFAVSGEDTGDAKQPQVTILIKVSSDELSDSVRLQTTVSARRLDI